MILIPSINVIHFKIVTCSLKKITIIGIEPKLMLTLAVQRRKMHVFLIRKASFFLSPKFNSFSRNWFLDFWSFCGNKKGPHFLYLVYSSWKSMFSFWMYWWFPYSFLVPATSLLKQFFHILFTHRRWALLHREFQNKTVVKWVPFTSCHSYPVWDAPQLRGKVTSVCRWYESHALLLWCYPV